VKKLLFIAIMITTINVGFANDKTDSLSNKVGVRITEGMLTVVFQSDTVLIGLNDIEVQKNPATAYSIGIETFTASIIYRVKGEKNKYEWHTFVFDKRRKELIGKKYSVIDSAAIKNKK